MMMAIVVVCGALRIGGNLLYYTIISLILNHFCILWETNHTKIMAFGIGSNSVTEGQIAMVAVHLTAYFYGTNTFWAYDTSRYFPNAIREQFFPQGLEFKYVFIGGAVLVMNGLAIIAAVQRVLACKSASQTRLQAMLQQLPNIILVVLCEILIRTSRNDLLFQHPRLLVTLLSLIEIHTIGNMVLKRQCDEPYNPIQFSLAPLFVIVANNFLSKPLFDELLGLKIYIVLLSLSSIRMFVGCIYQMCNALNVPFLRVKRKQ
jgi:hypothetical protein